MQHNFGQIEQINAPRSQFDRSNGHKFTCDSGWLIPFYWDMVMPGDTFNMNTQIFARIATPLFPIMDNMFVDVHYFSISDRLLWENSRKFYGEQDDPGDSIDFTIPTMVGTINSQAEPDLTTANGQSGALLNYMGVPNGINSNDVDINALPFRFYCEIWDEWFRDQNLQDSISILKDDVSTSDTQTVLKRRGKRADYFTSCLPWPQKGDAVSLPLGTEAPITGIGALNGTFGGTAGTARESGGAPTSIYPSFSYVDGTTGNNAFMIKEDADNTGFPEIYADLTNAASATVNELREAFQVQKLLERDARGGTRYSEIVRNHFGTTFNDLTYRPEYLGGFTKQINITPVATTSNTITGSQNFTGDLGAMGTASANGGFTKSFNEHGYVMGIMSIRADLTYQYGLRRELSKQTRYDMYWPTLAHLGEQEVLKKEIFCEGTPLDETVFGYNERYSEYRYKPSQISGAFQSSAVSSLDPWHLSQELDNTVALGDTFIQENPPLDRCIQVPSEPQFIVDVYNSLKCARPMPTFGTPGMIDHF